MLGNLESIPYLIISLGLIFLISLTSYGSCYGMTLAATSSSLYAHKKQVMTYSYIATIMSSSIFFQAFILVMIILSRMEGDYTMNMSLAHTLACLILGGTGYAVGILMGNISKEGFKKLYKETKFNISFVLLYATSEVILLFSFMASLILIYTGI
ncbi:V-type proton ATPase subunit C (VMA11) [Vairimorpha necatrix]|uniref:V-type proton ATPase subunit C (VMA11) n=1 Tax=Vairimorpha necatrix TaxID=6039 RepID=A0AAX4JFK5_9MICR